MKYVRLVVEQWQTILSGIVLAAMVHICTTFLAPHFYRSDAYSRLARSLPANTFVMLPQAEPKAQVIPYQMPDARYSVCSFDLSAGPLSIRAVLPEPGWTLVLYSPAEEGFYASPAPERRTTINLSVQPPGERFAGHLTETRGHTEEVTQVTSPAMRGMAVMFAPLKGRTYVAQTERDLAQTRCRQEQY